MAEYTTQQFDPWANATKVKSEKAAADQARVQSLQTQKDQIAQQKQQAISELSKSIMASGRGGDPAAGAEMNNLERTYDSQINALDGQINTIKQGEQGTNPDGSPIRPEYMSLIDPATGRLSKQYEIGIDTLNGGLLDTSKLEGYNALKGEAMRTGPSKWAQLMQQMLGDTRTADMEKASRQAGSSAATARGQLAMRGGLSSGARERVAQQSAHDLLGARQGIGRGFNTSNLQLLTDDEKQRMANLNQFTGMETDLNKFNIGQKTDTDKFNITNKGKADEFNIEAALAEKNKMDTQNMDVYKEMQKKWAADRQAQATQNSGSGGGGGCCFLFLEARYGDGTMDKVVRKFRDEFMTPKNLRGYYKLSEVLVPLMRKSKIIKFLVRVCMTSPMVAYGKFHYDENFYGFIFQPITRFWLKTFDYLGLEHQYIRENGETV